MPIAVLQNASLCLSPYEGTWELTAEQLLQGTMFGLKLAELNGATTTDLSNTSKRLLDIMATEINSPQQLLLRE